MLIWNYTGVYKTQQDAKNSQKKKINTNSRIQEDEGEGIEVK